MASKLGRSDIQIDSSMGQSGNGWAVRDKMGKSYVLPFDAQTGGVEIPDRLDWFEGIFGKKPEAPKPFMNGGASTAIGPNGQRITPGVNDQGYIPAPSVVTSQPAQDHLNKVNQDVQKWTGDMEGKKTAQIWNPATNTYEWGVFNPQTQAYDLPGGNTQGAQPPQDKTTKAVLDKISQITGPNSPPPGWDAQTYANFKTANPDLEPDEEDTRRMLMSAPEAALNDLYSSWDQIDQGFLSTLQQFQNGTFPLSPSENAQISSLQSMVQRQAEEQRLINTQLQSAYTNAGIAMGLNRGAPQRQASNLADVASRGLRKVADLELEGAGKVAELQTAIQDKNYKRILDLYNTTTNIFDRKATTLKDTIKDARQAIKDEAEARRTALEDATKRGTATAFYTYSQLGDNEEENGRIIDQAAKKAGISYEEMVGLVEKARQDADKAKKDSYLPGTLGEWQYYSQLTPDEQAKFNDFLDSKTQDHFSMSTDAYGNPLMYNTKTGQILPQTDVIGDQGSTANLWNSIPKTLRPLVERITGNWDNEQLVKNYNTVAESKIFVDSLPTGSGKTAADDQALIYAFAKAMDPNSAVKEGEYETISKNALSMLQRYGISAKRFYSNTDFLSDKAAEQLKQTINTKYEAADKQYQNIRNSYGTRINQITGRSDGTQFLTQYGQVFNQNLDQYYNSHPELHQKIDDLQRQYPDYSDEDLMQILTGQSTNHGTGGSYLSSVGKVSAPEGSSLWAPGLDVTNKKGTPITSPQAGTVIFAGTNGGFGNQVKVRLANGDEIWFGHLDATKVRPGTHIPSGTLLGFMGNTGNVLKMDGSKPTSAELRAGRGTHVDITMKRKGGGYYTAPEVQRFLTNYA